MQLAPTTANLVRSDTGVSDVVAPSKLIGIARQRLTLADSALVVGNPTFAPSSLVVTRALGDVLGAVQALNAVLVPSTPLQQRIIAGEALFQVRAGEEMLERYQDLVVHLPVIDLPRERVPVEALRALDIARDQLRRAQQLLS